MSAFANQAGFLLFENGLFSVIKMVLLINSVKLGNNELSYNKLGYNEFGYNEHGYNELGYNELNNHF